jgi:hypothetical protein
MMPAQRLIRFGAKLATRGLLARLGLGLGFFWCLFCIGRVFLLARRSVPSAHYAITISAVTMVWGAGICVAFGAALSAMKRDRVDGTFRLIVSRTGSARSYVMSRVGGLILLLSLLNGGSVLLVGLASMATSGSGHGALMSAWTTAASVLFGVCASVVIGLVCFAALGVSGRVTGYGRLLLWLFLPEVVRRMALSRLDVPGMDVMSIESALGALRESLLPNMVDPARFARAVFVLFVVSLAALAVVRRDADRLMRDGS